MVDKRSSQGIPVRTVGAAQRAAVPVPTGTSYVAKTDASDVKKKRLHLFLSILRLVLLLLSCGSGALLYGTAPPLGSNGAFYLPDFLS